MYIYVLKLRCNKYYIGKSYNAHVRISQHNVGNGAHWTKIYKPVSVVSVIDGDSGDEDKITLKYMKKYGVENVRGGTFCQYYLPSHVKKTIESMINGAADKCYTCGMTGHFANQCLKRQRYESDDDESSGSYSSSGSDRRSRRHVGPSKRLNILSFFSDRPSKGYNILSFFESDDDESSESDDDESSESDDDEYESDDDEYESDDDEYESDVDDDTSIGD